MRSSAWNTHAGHRERRAHAGREPDARQPHREHDVGGGALRAAGERGPDLAEREPARPDRDAERQHDAEPEREQRERRCETRGREPLHGAGSRSAAANSGPRAAAASTSSASSSAGPGSVVMPCGTSTTRPAATAGSEAQRDQ